MEINTMSLYSVVLENTIDYRPLTFAPDMLLADVLVLMSQVRGSCTLPIASDSLLDLCVRIQV